MGEEDRLAHLMKVAERKRMIELLMLAGSNKLGHNKSTFIEGKQSPNSNT
jgi:hypothetical protein